MFGLCVLVVLGAVGWISGLVLDLETQQEHSRIEMERLQDTRLALWRMDSWLAPLLAREAVRPWVDYKPYYNDVVALNDTLQPLGPGAVYKRSPLVAFTSPWFTLHFQIDSTGRLTSPQAPEGSMGEIASMSVLDADTLTRNGLLLDTNRGRLDRTDLLERLRSLEERLPAALAEDTDTDRNWTQQAVADNNDRKALLKRAKDTYAAKNAQQWQEIADELSGAEGLPATIGSLLPLWVDGDKSQQLVFVRRVRVGETELLQGFLADWPALRTHLLDLAREQLPRARLVPVSETALADDTTGLVLATVPVALVPPRLKVVSLDPWTPGSLAVLVTWIAVLTSILAAGLTLRAAIETAEKRRRFTSAVTHELRTPLTTFRMYTEMLAEDMVDEAKRREYLRTLQDESARLGALVENVLTYARLEEGRAPARRQPVPFGDLMDRLRPPLERRVADADGVLAVDVQGDTAAVVQVDSDAVSQILFNLVDNACKYGREGGAAAVTLSAETGSDTLRFRVTDRGPGVPAKHRAGVFKPFDRGDRGAGDAVQGVGLGLALARGLARELGGDLRLEDGAGTTFILELPSN